MHEREARDLKFTGPFRVKNIKVEIDIEETPSLYKDMIRALGRRSALIQPGETDYDRRVLLGLNELAVRCFRRGYRVFLLLLALLAGILVLSILGIAAAQLSQLTTVLFVAGVISFFLYAATTFTERSIGWVTHWLDGGRGYLLDDRMW